MSTPSQAYADRERATRFVQSWFSWWTGDDGKPLVLRTDAPQLTQLAAEVRQLIRDVREEAQS